jgi:hypothetical protein
MRHRPDSRKLTKAEARFRFLAFRMFYDNVFHHVGNPATRFACAVASSAGEIHDRRLFHIWWAWTEGRSIKGLLDSGKEPPEELRPFVESYMRALGERAKQTGDDVQDLD